MEDRIISYKGNTYGVRDVHKALLPILELFDEHCRKYSISYSLAYGSLLGCVRNHGFIPWDDDVDIMMNRSDFNCFIKSFEKQETELSKRCFLECPRFLYKLREKANSNSFFIDIYPADHVPNNIILEKMKLVLVQLLRQIIIGRNGRRYTLIRLIRKFLAYLVSFPISKRLLVKIYSFTCSIGNDKESDRICFYCTTNACYGRYHSNVILNKIQYSSFEDIKMPIIERYDLYLTREYGNNYMTPPQKEKRNPTHSIINKK